MDRTQSDLNEITMKSYKNCQSCGMPLKNDPRRGGTEADGTRNFMYCSYCYDKGQFVHPDWTVEMMQDFCEMKLREMGFPRFITKMMIRNLPKLERWKEQHHKSSTFTRTM